MEVKRQMDVLDRRLAENEYLGGTQYTIADIAVWPWYGALAAGLVYEAGEFLQVADYKNVQRWTDAIAKRPAVQREADGEPYLWRPGEPTHARATRRRRLRHQDAG